MSENELSEREAISLLEHAIQRVANESDRAELMKFRTKTLGSIDKMLRRVKNNTPEIRAKRTELAQLLTDKLKA
jgi:hypothetical protein